MYHIGLLRPLRAHHFLIGADFGPENQPHYHDYRFEWTLEGPTLDDLGFLLDLTLVEHRLATVLDALEGRMLNEEPELAGLNPSVERLARLVSDRLVSHREAWDPQSRLTRSVLRVWEHDTAWASWTEDLHGPGAWV